MVPTGDLAHNPGMCPDWESHWRPLGLWGNVQPTEPHQLELLYFVFNRSSYQASLVSLILPILAPCIQVVSFVNDRVEGKQT